MNALPYHIKRLIFSRALKAWLLSMTMQILLFAVSLLVAHFNPLHPIAALQRSFRLFFSFYSGITIIWLGLLLFYSVFWCHACLVEKYYYGTRFMWGLNVGSQKVVLLGWQLTFGLVTAGIYAGYLNDQCGSFFTKCNDKTCLSNCNVFLYVCGIIGSLYYFIKFMLNQEAEVEFPIICERPHVQIRTQVLSTLSKFMFPSLLPVVISVCSFWLLNDAIVKFLGGIFGLNGNEDISSFVDIATNLYLIFNAWIIIWQIQCNLHLVRGFLDIFMTQPHKFPIEASECLTKEECFTLANALNLHTVPPIQLLASKMLFELAHSNKLDERAQIFSLSQPGNHPFNWSVLSTQCLCLINNYTEQFSLALMNISNVKAVPLYATVGLNDQQAAEKILLRQYNEKRGIRSMIDSKQEAAATVTLCAAGNNTLSYRVKKKCDLVVNEMDQQMRFFGLKLFHKLVKGIPGFIYLFCESDDSRTIFLLTQSQIIIWLTQALATLAKASLSEDKYGVVQSTLPKIIKALLNLKQELDKLNSVNLNRKKLNFIQIAIKAAVKRSLYIISIAFGDYLKDLAIEPEDYKQLQSFLWFQET